MNIVQMLIPEQVKPKYLVNGKKVTFPMVPEYITIHETANTAKGANDLAHANLQKNGNSRQASWHLQVDDDSCYQSLPFNEAGIHAGDGVNGDGNRKSIGIEICVNVDGDFGKSVKNAAKVTAILMKQFSIPSNKIVPHKHWSGKNCPSNLLKNGWEEFINLCIEEREKLEQKKEVTHVVDQNDTKGHWAEKSIEKAKKKKIICGYADGSFKPDEPVTRAQLAVILDRLKVLD